MKQTSSRFAQSSPSPGHVCKRGPRDEDDSLYICLSYTASIFLPPPGLKCMTRLKSGGKGKTSHSPYRDDSEECFFFRRGHQTNGEDGIFFAALRWRCYRIPKLSPLRFHFRPFRGFSQLCMRLERDVGRLHLLVFLPPSLFDAFLCLGGAGVLQAAALILSL